MTKKIPLRKCIACGKQKEKKDLFRIVNNVDEGVLVDKTGKKNGRGAYICKDISCLEKAKKKNLLRASLKMNIGEEFYEEIIKDVEL